MSLTKNEMILKAIDEDRVIWFTFKKDGSERCVEPYAFYRDDRGNLKVWAYQPGRMGTGQKSGPRVFFIEDMTYIMLGESFERRAMKEPPNAYSVLAEWR